MSFHLTVSDMMQLLLILVLIALSAFFSSSETALTTVNRIRVRNLAEEGDKKAIRLNRVIEDQGKMLSAILIGNNLVNIAASAIFTVLITRWFIHFGIDALAPVVSTLVLTALILFFGEITPKTMATVKAEEIALSIAGWIEVWMFAATPMIWILNILSKAFIRVFGINPDQKPDTYTEDEIRIIVDASHEEGEIESEEREMINNVFDFGDTKAKDIMVPKVDIEFLDIEAGFDDVMQLYRENLFTRYPVFEESSDNVIGMINIKDLVLYEDKEHFSIREIMRPVIYTHELKSTSDLFKEMRKKRLGLAIVLDEYGVTSGMVTLEDLIEEIVGDINDEFDYGDEGSAHRVGKNEYEVPGAMSLDDVNDDLKIKDTALELASENYDSVGGLIIELLDHLPTEGEEVRTSAGVRLRVDKLEKKHIETVRIFLPEAKTADNE